MKLQREKYPDFYKKRDNIIEEESSDIFVGRKIQLTNFWDYLYDLTKNRRQNYALLGQRKMGKTASMTRFFNVAFWEQEQVVPLYYCFSNKRKKVDEVADEIFLTWLKQWLAFHFKDPSYIEVKDFDYLKERLEENTEVNEKITIVLNEYQRMRIRSIARDDEVALLDHVFLMVTSLVGWFRKHCVCIVDEIQEMASGVLIDSKGRSINNPGAIERMAEHPKVWTIVSGSQVSMLHHRVLVGDIANRIADHHFTPLEESESNELVRAMLKEEGYKKVYRGLEKDVYQRFSGHPFYTISLFKKNWEFEQEKNRKKSFHTRKEFEEAYNFEVGNPKGRIYQFWDKHFIENAEKLNNAPPERPGLTYDMMRYLIDKPATTYDELGEKFQLDYSEVRSRCKQLEHADLIYSINDPVLKVILPQIQYKKFYQPIEKKGPATAKEMLVINKRIAKLNKDVSVMKKHASKTEKDIKSVRGDLNRLKGGNLEEEVKEAILNGCKILKGYEVVGDLDKIFVGKPGSKENEIDLAGCIKKKRSKTRIGLAIEVKNRKSKVSSKEAEKFIQSVKKYQRKRKYKSCTAIFVNRGGFSGPAKKLLEKNGVVATTLDKFFEI